MARLQEEGRKVVDDMVYQQISSSHRRRRRHQHRHLLEMRNHC